MNSEIPAVTKLYDIIIWLIPQVEKFPRSIKYTLGDRIMVNVLESLELIIEAVYTKKKQMLLRDLNIKLEKLRYMIRLAKDLKALSIKKYGFISGEINELGKMIGGWIKAEHGKNI